jgi:cytochrome c556
LKHVSIFCALAMAAALTACGEGADTPAPAAEVDPAIKSAIETRQASLKDLGASMKTLGDQTKSASPDMAAITEAAAKVQTHAAAIGTWFPAGSGSSSGVKTEALDTIWSDAAGFQAAVEKFQAEAANINAAAATGDPAAVGAAIPALGGSCKNCHDTYRLKTS